MSLAPVPSTEELANIAAQMVRCIPDLATRSTVALVQANGQLLRQMGSGTLLAIAEHRFVVTAAHVVQSAMKDGRTLGVSGSVDGKFIATTGTWIASKGDNGQTDPFDIAIYELSTEQAGRFPVDSFVRIGDASFDIELSEKFFLVTGFPGMWSTTTATDAEPMKSRMLQYGTFALQGSTAGLSGFDPQYHFLLEAKPDHTVDETGHSVTFRTRTGFPAQMPADLGGVSGSSIWAIGDIRIPFTEWSSKQSRLVGVQTSVYATRGAIRATRWNAVTTLVYQAYPAIRPTIQMYAQID